MPLRARLSPTVKQLDRAHLGRTSDADELQVARADGSWLYDVHGRKYLDFVMGWCVGNLGWNPPEVRERLQRFDGPDYVVPSALYKPWAELACLLAEVTPGKLTRAFRVTTGSEAVELALQAARSFTGREKFVALADAYHGNSLAEKELQRHTIKPPLDAGALDRIETALKKRDVAAFIMEPIVCNLGVVVPAPELMRGVGELCARYGTLFIADEVATGFGRTGKLFATEHYELEPDILCLAKALTAGVAPMGATLMTDEVFDGLDDDFSFYATYGWHPRAVEAALANVKYWKRHARALLDNVARRSVELGLGLGAIDFGCGSEVRVAGLAVAIEFDEAGYADKLEQRCRERGLLISCDDDTAMIFPALNVDAALVAEGVAIIAAAAAGPRRRSYSRSSGPA
jgi:acetylornithine/succinyldiaminopimelate/putrescine aminotransferase